jgi:hypothetical protein
VREIRVVAALDGSGARRARERPLEGGLHQRRGIQGLPLQGDGAHELQALRHRLGQSPQLLRKVGHKCALLRPIGQTPPQQTRQHLHAGQRIADLVGQAGRHLPQRRQAVAQTLLFVGALEGRQVAEQHRRAAHATQRVSHGRQREADGAAGAPARALENQLRPGEHGAPVQGFQQQPRDTGLPLQHGAAVATEDSHRIPRGATQDTLRPLVDQSQVPCGVDAHDARAQAREHVRRECVIAAEHPTGHRRARARA